MTFLDELRKTKLAAVELFRRRPRGEDATKGSKTTLPPVQTPSSRAPASLASGPQVSSVRGATLPSLVSRGRSSLVRGSDWEVVTPTRGSDSNKAGLLHQKSKAQQRKLSLDLPKDESKVSKLRPEDEKRIQRKIVAEAEFKERTRRDVDRTWPIHSQSREQIRTGHSQNLSKTISEDLSTWSATRESRRAYKDSAPHGDLTSTWEKGNRGHGERASGQVVKLPEIYRPKFVPKKESTPRIPVPPKQQDATKAAGFVTRKPQPVSYRQNRYYKPDPSLDELLDFNDLPDYGEPKIVSRPVHHRRHDSDPRARRFSDVRAKRDVPLPTRRMETAGSHDLNPCQKRLVPEQKLMLPPVKVPACVITPEKYQDDPLEGLESLLCEAERRATRRQTARTECEDPLNGLEELLSDVEQMAGGRNRRNSSALLSSTPDDVNKKSASRASYATCASGDSASCSGSVDSCSSLWAQVEKMKRMHEEKRRERKRRQRLQEFGEEEDEEERDGEEM